MSLTRSNIAYDLTISPHRLDVPYDNGNAITFVFSSNLYKEIFYNKLYDNRNKINTSLSNRFGIVFINDLLADIRLYSITEKRGFYLIINGEEIKCVNDIILDGHNLMKQS